jgi:dGTPase
MLSRLRFDAGRTAGRRYPETPHPYRNDFRRDRDRVIHSRAFRRLEDKTQVFPAGLSDHFRNRLTHTIEVTQISRTVASALELNEDLTEALALVHDIGHPPFAHAGEEELDRQMRRFDESFDHNQHALRIVERFEHSYARFPGLNLTFEVREGIVKHSRDLVPGESPELDEYLPELRPPLEAQLIDLCDEIAYNAADLDDALSAILIEPDKVRERVPLYDRLFETAEMQFPGAPQKVQLAEVLRAMVNYLVTGLIEGTLEAARDVPDVETVRGRPDRVARFTAETAETSLQLKQLLRSTIYSSVMIVEERRKSTGKIAEMFGYLLAHPDVLPEDYLEDTSGQPLHRTVCDYIAGMTDGFFGRMYDELLGPASTSWPVSR